MSLEFADDLDRKEARKALAVLFGLCDHGGAGIRLPEWDKNCLRKKLIMHLAELLVGDVEFEEKT